MAHPGEVAAAEDFCTHVQERIVAQAEKSGQHMEEACMRVHIISSVHTDVEAFIRSQPTLQLCQGTSPLFPSTLTTFWHPIVGHSRRRLWDCVALLLQYPGVMLTASAC